MSNARSPREVCSTTIGTSGLTVLASFRFGRSSPAQLAWAGSPGDSLAIARIPKTRLFGWFDSDGESYEPAGVQSWPVDRPCPSRPGVQSLSRARAWSVEIGFAG